jgi:hypothetical protein
MDAALSCRICRPDEILKVVTVAESQSNIPADIAFDRCAYRRGID